MNQVTSKSGIRTDEKIEAHNCPILCTCGYIYAGAEDEWNFCGYFAGTLDVTADLLVVRCNCQGKLVFSCEN